MKTIKLLLIISQILVGVQFINAQVMMSNVSYMYLSRDVQNVRKFLVIDINLSNAKDTDIEYIIMPGESMLVNGNKVYYKIKKFPNSKVDTILYFDFNLKVNDKINRGYFNYLYVVDSIKSIQLLDGNFYLHWFLSSMEGGNLIWIKGLGDNRMGWIRDDAAFTPEVSPKLQAICRNNNIVFWYNGYNFFEPDTVKPTCDFDSLNFKYTSISQINSNSFKIYPNPATEKLTITFDNHNIKNAIANIYDSKGCLVKTEAMVSNEININNLNQGLYFLTIESGEKNYCIKFIKQ